MLNHVNYEDWLAQRLKDPKKAKGYLNAVLEDLKQDNEDSKNVLLLALKDITNAIGGMGKLSQKSGLNRESLYKTLSAQGNPRLDTFMTLLESLGLRMNIEIVKKPGITTPSVG